MVAFVNIKKKFGIIILLRIVHIVRYLLASDTMFTHRYRVEYQASPSKSDLIRKEITLFHIIISFIIILLLFYYIMAIRNDQDKYKLHQRAAYTFLFNIDVLVSFILFSYPHSLRPICCLHCGFAAMCQVVSRGLCS